MLRGVSACTACPPLQYHTAVHCSVNWWPNHTHQITIGVSCCKYVKLQAYFTLLVACTLRPSVTMWVKKRPWWKCYLSVGALSCYQHQFACLYFLYSTLPSSSQGVPLEFLCRPTSAGLDLDVRSARHDGQALHPLSDPLCGLWLAAGFCHCDGALYPTERGRGWFEIIFVSPVIFVCSDIQAVRLCFCFFSL